MTLRNTDSVTKILVLLGIIIITIDVVASFVLVRHTHAFVDATTHQPERYTELYFSDPDTLPANVTAAQKLPVDFTIHNVEARTTAYTYTIDFTAPTGHTTVLEQQSLTLANDQAVTIADTVQLPAFAGRGEISVQLLHEP